MEWPGRLVGGRRVAAASVDAGGSRLSSAKERMGKRTERMGKRTERMGERTERTADNDTATTTTTTTVVAASGGQRKAPSNELRSITAQPVDSRPSSPRREQCAQVAFPHSRHRADSISQRISRPALRRRHRHRARGRGAADPTTTATRSLTYCACYRRIFQTFRWMNGARRRTATLIRPPSTSSSVQ